MKPLTLVAVCLLPLVGCSPSDAMQAADANAREALAQTEELKGRISDLGSRIDDLEDEIELLKSENE